jgi:hypothetical protein
MTARSGNGHDHDRPQLEFPCRYDLKVVGRANGRFEALTQAIVDQHVPETDRHVVQSRPSRDANYVALTYVITARSRPQLDAIYQALSDCGEVLFAL